MDKEFYDTSDVMRALGVSKQAVWKYVQAGKLRPVSPNSYYHIFTPAEFKRFIDSKTKGLKNKADNV